jgi:SPP1 gp7 family putative phage head morphogenesis protein
MIEDSQSALITKLYKLRSKSGRFTYVLMQQTKAQLDFENNELRKALYEHGRTVFPQISEYAVNDLAETLQKADKLFTGIVTPLQITEASYMEYIVGKATGSVLRSFKSSVTRYGIENIEKVERIMSKSILAKDDFMSVIKNIQGTLGQSQYKAERIVRTETASVYGRTQVLSTQEAKRELPDLKKRWVSSPDACDCCLSLNNMIIDVNQLFTCRAGKTSLDSLHEPIHPNCKCSVVGWREAWGK